MFALQDGMFWIFAHLEFQSFVNAVHLLRSLDVYVFIYISNCNVCLRIINVMSPLSANKFMNLPRFHFIYHHFGIMKNKVISHFLRCGSCNVCCFILSVAACFFFSFARCSFSVCIQTDSIFVWKSFFVFFFSFFIPATRPNMPTIAIHISYFLCSQIGNCISNETLFLLLLLWFRSQKKKKWKIQKKRHNTIHKQKFLKNNKRRQYVGVLCVFLLSVWGQPKMHVLKVHWRRHNRKLLHFYNGSRRCLKTASNSRSIENAYNLPTELNIERKKSKPSIPTFRFHLDFFFHRPYGLGKKKAELKKNKRIKREEFTLQFNYKTCNACFTRRISID